MMLYNKQLALALKNLRERVGITGRQLCAGVCSDVMYSRYERGELKPDILTLIFLSERVRMKVPWNGLLCHNSDKIWIGLRKKIDISFEMGMLYEVEKLLEEYSGLNFRYGDILHRQYVLLQESYLEEAKGNYETALNACKSAMKLTNISETNAGKNYIISRQEFEILIRYWRLNDGPIEAVRAGMLNLIDRDDNDSVKKGYFAAVSLLLADLEIKENHLKRALFILDQAMNYQKKICQVRMMRAIIAKKCEICICLGLGVTEEDSRMKSALETVRKLLQIKNEKINTMPDLVEVSKSELLRNARISAKMTQEELAEGICDVSTLKRYEKGSVEPDNDKYAKLIVRAGGSINGSLNLYGSIKSNAYLMEKTVELTRNQKKVLIVSKLKDIDPEFDGFNIGATALCEEELELMSELVDCYIESGEQNAAEFLLMELKRYTESSFVISIGEIYSKILLQLSEYYFETGKTQLAYDYTVLGIKEAFSNDSQKSLPGLLFQLGKIRTMNDDEGRNITEAALILDNYFSKRNNCILFKKIIIYYFKRNRQGIL